MLHIASIGSRYGSGGRLERPDARAAARKQSAILSQIAGQEDDQDDLEQLRWLACERPDAQRQARPAGHLAKYEHEQQQGYAGGGPGVLVAAQPAVAADEDGGRGQHGQASRIQTSWSGPRPQLRAADRLDNQVLGQALHHQERDTREQGGNREEDLVHAPPRDHEQAMNDGQRNKVCRQHARIGQFKLPVPE